MSTKPAATGKPPFWETIRTAWRPYKRLYGYVRPYKWRFVVGLAAGFAYGGVCSYLPWVMAQVTSFVFHGATPSATDLRSHPEMLTAGPKINSIVWTCLSLPLVMSARSFCSYVNAYYMAWVSNKVVTDIRTELFSKIAHHSMDFFNRMQAGFLISRITNDTRGMQAALSSVSSDLFKQPVTIIGGIAVLLYMDWKFTLVTLILFPICIAPIRIYGRRARKAVEGEQEELGQMVVTMQETFAGIRVVKSFAREDYKEKSFRRSNQIQFSNAMRMIKSTEAVGPLVETVAAIGVGLALLYVYTTNLSAGLFFGLITGIFILYDPIKTLSKIHIVMQRSQSITSIFKSSPAKATLWSARAAQASPPFYH